MKENRLQQQHLAREEVSYQRVGRGCTEDARSLAPSRQRRHPPVTVTVTVTVVVVEQRIESSSSDERHCIHQSQQRAVAPLRQSNRAFLSCTSACSTRAAPGGETCGGDQPAREKGGGAGST